MRDDAGATAALAPVPGRVLGADPHDFAGLYIRHRSSFTSHARRYLRDPRDADEVVQEAFLRLFLALPELETELQALAYCRRTITNLCIDRYRADARRPRLVALEGAPVDELAEDDGGDPVVRAEDAALVREALSKLPVLHRAALVMREVEEKPLPVIADELDVAEDSVKHLLFRARRALRKLLAGTSVAPGVDADRAGGLRPVARGASSGVAGLLLLALLGLGSGPDLRAVPVVGVDLPDVLGVTAVADAVGEAVRDAVGVVVPGERADAAAAHEPRSAPVSRPAEQAVAGRPAGAAVGEPTTATTGASTGAAARERQVVAGTGPGAGTSGTSTRVVDGALVVTVVPPTGAVPGADVPAKGGRSVSPVPAGRGPGPLSPAASDRSLREVPAAAPVDAVPVVARQPVRPADAGTSSRSPRAEDAARPAARTPEQPGRSGEANAGVAAKAQEKAAEKAEKAAERAAQKAERAATKAAVAPEQPAVRTGPVLEQPAVRAEKAAEKAADKAQKAAAKEQQKVAARAVAERVAAERAAARAAEVAAAQAAARAAELAAAQAAARAAEVAAAQAAQEAAAAAAAQAAAPVSAVPPATATVAAP